MAQRLILKAKDDSIPIQEMIQFVNAAVEYGVHKLRASYDLDTDGELRIMVSLPKDKRVVGRRVVRLKPKTAKQQRVDKQIKSHQSAKKSGKGAGYVPPEGKTKAPVQKKVKCPKCDVRKPVVTISGVRMVKPHMSHGESCPGGGTQVVRRS
jgi:hypothetical protein